MNTVKTEWIKKLRDPESKQTFGLYRTKESYCAVGLLMDTLGVWEKAMNNIALLAYLSEEGDISTELLNRVFSMNDTWRRTFGEIADYLESGDTGVT